MTSQQLADEGEKIIFGGIGKNKEQGAVGKGQCPLCHAFHAGMLGERAPNLLGLIDRAGKERLDDPKYSKGKPAAREYEQKEAFPGSGTAESGQEYIAESHACPSCYVVVGYGVKGTNDKSSPMPAIHKPPISLSLQELAAVDTWLYVREGRDAPSYDEIIKSYEKFIPEAERPKQQEDKPAGAGGSLLVDGTEPIDVIFSKATCAMCHTIPGIPRRSRQTRSFAGRGDERTEPNQGSGIQGDRAQHSRVHHGVDRLAQYICRKGLSRQPDAEGIRDKVERRRSEKDRRLSVASKNGFAATEGVMIVAIHFFCSAMGVRR